MLCHFVLSLAMVSMTTAISVLVPHSSLSLAKSHVFSVNSIVRNLLDRGHVVTTIRYFLAGHELN